jgi:hypothetical protein
MELKMEMRSIVSAQPGWYSVTLSDDQSELEEYPVIAWMLEDYDEEWFRKHAEYYDDKEHLRPRWFGRKIMSTILAPATPINLHGEAEGGSCGVLKDPDGTYWLQGDRLTREEALSRLRIIQEIDDEINSREAAE